MAGADPKGEVVAERSGVTLRKRAETGTGGRPAIAVVLRAERTDAVVAVRVIETVPDTLAPGDVGFFETDGRQPWSIKGPKLVFEAELEPGETLESWIGARGDRADAIGALLDEPDEFDVHPTERHEPVALAERLLAELRSGDVPAETKRALRSALAPEEGALETRVRQLQTDVADLRAYDGAMETFVDVHGPPAAIVERLERRLERLEAKVSNLEEAHGEVGADVERLEVDVEGRLAALSDRVDEVTRLLNGLPFLERVDPEGSIVGDDELAAVESDVVNLEATVEELASEMAALSAELERLDGRLPDRDVEERLAALSDRVERLSEFMAGLRTAFEQ